MRLRLKSRFAAPAGLVWVRVQRSATLCYIAAPLIEFRPVDPPLLPERFDPGAYTVGMRLFGLVPLGRQVIRPVVEEERPEVGRFCLLDAGSGTLIRRWDHRIRLAASGNGTDYEDDLFVEAGLLTPLVWLFAWIFYRHRQQRLKTLLARATG